MANRKESDILRAIMDYLKVRRVFFFRVNTTGIYDPGKHCFRKSPNTTCGVSDLIAFKNGKMICLEVKNGKAKQSEDQLLFEANIRVNGAAYYVVRSVQDVISLGL